MLRGVIQYVRSPEETAKAFKPAVAKANADAVAAWHDRYVAGHFTEEAFSKYGYTTRKGQNEPEWVQRTFKIGKIIKKEITRTVRNDGYWWVKLRKFHERTPLVLTGDSMEAAINGAFKISSTSASGHGVFMGLPQSFYQWRERTGGGHIDKAAELLAITEDEITELGKVHQASIEASIEADKVRSEFIAA